jgi:hypothetical protein
MVIKLIEVIFKDGLFINEALKTSYSIDEVENLKEVRFEREYPGRPYIKDHYELSLKNIKTEALWLDEETTQAYLDYLNYNKAFLSKFKKTNR